MVSGYQLTGNFGQSVTCTDPANPMPQTCTNLGGSPFGSHDPRKIGTFDIPVPAGNYMVEVESINPGFDDGSSVGPLDPPIAAPGTAPQSSTISVAAGAMVIHDVTLQNTPPRFDSFESARLELHVPMALWLRREKLLAVMLAG